MKQNLFKRCACAVLLLCLFPADVFADDCANLDKNAEWADGMQKLYNGAEAKDYAYIIETAKPLYAICNRAPELNYFTGIALMNTGDQARALRYLQEASKYTSEFSVNPVMSRKIWYTLYEAENPDRTTEAVAALKVNIDKLNADVEDKKQQISDLKTEIATTKLETSGKVKETEETVRSNYARTMWTGAGVGIAGLLVATGGFLMAHFVTNNEKGQVTPQYITGWSLFGAGIGMTVAGAIAAGIGGYQYTHAAISDDVTVSFGITPTSASFGMTF